MAHILDQLIDDSDLPDPRATRGVVSGADEPCLAVEITPSDHRTVLDEFLNPRLCMEPNSSLRGRASEIPAQRPFVRREGFLAVQLWNRGGCERLHLSALCDFAIVCGSREI